MKNRLEFLQSNALSTPPQYKNRHHRPAAAILLAAMALAMLPGPAMAQLTDADIAALRLRGEAAGWTFSVGKSEATEIPLHQLTGAVEPPHWRTRGRFDDSALRGALPTRFDWRDFDACTPVRNQGGCGACWGFAALGTMESWLKRTKGKNVNLSEQWLVSCTSAGTCAGGWHSDAYEYLQCGGWPDSCGGHGAVLEADFPYAVGDVPCGCPYEHPYCLSGWSFVGPQWATPSASQIKQAILDHGPVAVCVYVNDAFHGYSGGIFNACEAQWINHAVVLVGWDDNQGTDGVWILRNSWGRDWGEQGYMRIEYGCSEVGYAAAYIDYPATDCNGNGRVDFCEVDCDQLGGLCAGTPGCGTANDCNGNYMPDECELDDNDCNDNGVPDDCDAAALIASQPIDVPDCPGEDAVFSADAPGADAFRWYKDGQPLADGGGIAGTTTDTLTVAVIDADDEGTYVCEATDGCISAVSEPVLVELAVPVTIVTQPTQQTTKCNGNTATFVVGVTGTPPMTYEWRKDGQPLVDDGRITGSAATTMHIAQLTAADSGAYTCYVVDPCGNAEESNGCVLAIASPVFTLDPQDTCAEIGQAAVFTADAISLPTQTVGWRWKKNGVAISDGGVISGSRTRTLTISPVSLTDASAYTALAYSSNPVCLTDSAPATLTVGGCVTCAHPGDMDGDGDYDLADMQAFVRCFGADPHADTDCACAKVGETDGPIDLSDWTALEAMITGPNQ